LTLLFVFRWEIWTRERVITKYEERRGKPSPTTVDMKNDIEITVPHFISRLSLALLGM